MGTHMLLGVIDCGEWRVAQNFTSFEKEPEDSGTRLISILKNCSTDIYNNLYHCMFIATDEEDIPESIEEYPTLSSLMGIDILTEIAYCEKYDSIPLIDSRSFFQDECECEYAFIIDYDTNKLTCYICGNRFVFGEYDLNELPETNTFVYDFKKTQLANIDEIVEIRCRTLVSLFHRMGDDSGSDVDVVINSIRKSLLNQCMLDEPIDNESTD